MLPLVEMPRSLLEAVNVLASDIDDTITLQGRLTSQTIEAFARLDQVDVLLLLVTGRSSGWAQAMASYLPHTPFVIAENGLTMFNEDSSFVTIAADHLKAFSRAALDASAELLIKRFSLEPTSDDPFRLYERTFLRPDWFTAGSGQEMNDIVEQDQEVIASSIHLHLRPAGWGKAAGVRAALKCTELRRRLRQPPSVIMIGDSANDRPLFRYFHESSVGVANVAESRDELGDDMPRYVTQGLEGDGFIELVDLLVAVKHDRS